MSNAARKQDFDRRSMSAPSKAVDIVRDFNASTDRLWQAWSTPELAQRWWGPEGFTSPGAKIDFRVGGKYVLGMRAPDGKEFWSTGTYREITEPKRIVCTDQFSDPQGNVISAQQAGMKGQWPESLTITVTFEEAAPGKTHLTLHHVGVPSEMHTECVEGWNGSLDKLQRLVEGGIHA